MPLACSGAILAGGLNTRFAGKDKSKIVIGGIQIRDHLLNLFHELFDEIFIITNDPLQHLEADAHIVTDIFPIQSALTGIHTGLTYASNPFTFFSACDTPFLKADLVAHLVAQIAPGRDVIVPKTAAGYEPLCAVYAKRCLKPIEQLLNQNRPTIRLLFATARVETIPEPVLKAFDPELTSFLNINTPADLQKARAVWGHRK